MLGRCYALALLAVALALPAVRAQNPGSYNEIDTKARGNVQDKGEVWILKFRFYSPRLITVDIPGRGRRLCWYLLYHVSNPDPKEPHTFHPLFELVTHDGVPRSYRDQVLPTAQKAIQQIEDPTGLLNIQNSVTIENTPLPPTRPGSTPRYVTGVAIWDDVNPETNQFSILVTGLSNGWSVDDRDVLRRKTLILDFQRLGDSNNKDARDIRFVRDRWEYLALSKKPAETPKPKDKSPDAGRPADKPADVPKR